MPQRKPWTEQEDLILKQLRQERAEKKWSVIARKMATEFGIFGKTGKQCRERYHNNLDSSIVTHEWTRQQNLALFSIHKEVGNKWSIISQHLPGRSENNVKNHFYSKLRKAIRRLNKIIADDDQKSHKQIKASLLYKIIETTESKFKLSSKIDEQIAEYCVDIKNRLFNYEEANPHSKLNAQELAYARKLIKDIKTFEQGLKRGCKGIKYEVEPSMHTKRYLKVAKINSLNTTQSLHQEDKDPNQMQTEEKLKSSLQAQSIKNYESRRRTRSRTIFKSRSRTPKRQAKDEKHEDGPEDRHERMGILNHLDFDQHEHLPDFLNLAFHDIQDSQLKTQQHYSTEHLIEENINMFYEDRHLSLNFFCPKADEIDLHPKLLQEPRMEEEEADRD